VTKKFFWWISLFLWEKQFSEKNFFGWNFSKQNFLIEDSYIINHKTFKKKIWIKEIFRKKEGNKKSKSLFRTQIIVKSAKNDYKYCICAILRDYDIWLSCEILGKFKWFLLRRILFKQFEKNFNKTNFFSNKIEGSRIFWRKEPLSSFIWLK